MNKLSDITEYKDVLICGELTDNKISAVTSELLNVGRELCDSFGEKLHILLIGTDIDEAVAEAITLGADTIRLAAGVPFEESPPHIYIQIITGVCEQLKPRIVLFGQTDMGREIAPRLAAKLDKPITLDCVKLAVDPDSQAILLIKPVYGGNAMAVWKAVGQNTQIATIRPRVTDPAKPESSHQGEILKSPEIEDKIETKETLLCTVKEKSKGIRLEEAKVVVGGGGGVGGEEGFRLIEELAQTLRGAVGTSRVPCDEGWVPKNLEIGQTGHMVSPDVYIAIGISGAPQHLAGCSGSRIIVAINKDPDAHIFKESDLGIVGDYREALPSLIEKLKSILDD
jgi:electron transfer flavoprotein alpha subunit